MQRQLDAVAVKDFEFENLLSKEAGELELQLSRAASMYSEVAGTACSPRHADGSVTEARRQLAPARAWLLRLGS